MSHGERGFTLTELLVALVLLSIGMLALAGLMGTSGHAQGDAVRRADMTALAETKLEELKAIGRSATPDTVQLGLGGSLAASTADHADTLMSASGEDYVTRWEVQDGPGPTRTVMLRVEPSENVAQGGVEQLDFSTLVLIER